MRAAFSAAILLIAGLAFTVSRSAPEEAPAQEPRPVFETNYPITEVTPTNEEGQRLDQVVQRMRYFEKTLRETEAQLLAGTVTVEEAGSRVVESAKQNNKPFLIYMTHSDPKLSLEAKALRVLLNRIEIAEKSGALTAQQKERGGVFALRVRADSVGKLMAHARID